MRKNLFFAAIAAVALTSCSKSESVFQANGKAIGFDTYVSKNTKGVPVGTTSFAEGATIAVYSTKDGTMEMNNVVVTKGAGGWTYSPIMFYVANKSYEFTAFAPGNAGVDISTGVVTSYTVPADITQQVDFMYTPATITRMWDGQQSSVVDDVQFAFVHALSQVKFSAKSDGDFSSMYTVKISGVTIKGVNSVGTLTMTTNAWSAQETPISYAQPVADFTLTPTMAPLANSATATNNNVLMLIPQTWTQPLEVDVTIEVTAITAGGGDATKDGTKTLTATIPASTWERNKIYNYQMNLDLSTILDLKKIVFGEPSITDWDATVTDTPIVNN